MVGFSSLRRTISVSAWLFLSSTVDLVDARWTLEDVLTGRLTMSLSDKKELLLAREEQS
jgi:hypothetical protein